ncbi:hypothetical protein OROHE_015405 [Orobanche hederae]
MTGFFALFGCSMVFIHFRRSPRVLRRIKNMIDFVTGVVEVVRQPIVALTTHVLEIGDCNTSGCLVSTMP